MIRRQQAYKHRDRVQARCIYRLRRQEMRVQDYLIRVSL